jgi:hypothetical protein
MSTHIQNGITYTKNADNTAYVSSAINADLSTETTILSSVTINSVVCSVTSIGSSSFINCSVLTSVTIPNTVTTIGNTSFRGCTNLSSITIPNSVTNLGNFAFQTCRALASVIFQETSNVPRIGSQCFQGCTSLESIVLPNSVTSIANSAFQNCSRLLSFVIPSSVTSIGNSAFQDCTGLTSIVIPTSVNTIGTDAFLRVPSSALTGTYTPTINAGFYHSQNYIKVYLINTQIITNYSYSTDGTNYTELSPAQTTSPLTINVSSNSSIRIKGVGNRTVGTYTINTTHSESSIFTPTTLVNLVTNRVATMTTILNEYTSEEIKAEYTATELKAEGYSQQEITQAGYTQTASPTLTNFANILKILADGSFQLVAPSSNSGGSISYTSSDTTVATISGTIVTTLQAGTTTITALQAETSTYYGDATIQSTLTVLEKYDSDLAIGTIAPKIYGDAAFTLPVTSSSTGLKTYTSSNTSVATVSSIGLVTIVGAGSTMLSVLQDSDTRYFVGSTSSELTVEKGSAILSISGISSKTYGDAPFQITVSSVSPGEISYSSSNDSVATISNTGLITIVGAGSTTITVNQAEVTNYNEGSTSSVLTVGKGTAILSISGISSKTYGGVPFQITVSSVSPGTISYSSSNGSVATISNTGLITIVGAGTTTITVSQPEVTNYNSVSTSSVLTVNENNSGNPTFITNGGELSYFLNTSAVYGTISNDILLSGGKLVSSGGKKVIKASKRVTIKRS